MKSLLLASAFVASSMVASATTVTSVCGSFSNPSTGSSGTWSCNSLTTILGIPGATVNSEKIVYVSDYSNGISTPVSETTTFVFQSGFGLVNDLVTTSGTGNSNTPVSFLGWTYNATAAPVLAGFYQNVTSGQGNAFNITYNNVVGTGSVLAATGYVQVVYDYSPAVAPEPASFAMIGGGLLALAAFARKRNA